MTSILTPAEHGTLFTGKLGTVRNIKTSVGELTIPSEILADASLLSRYAELMESAVDEGYRAADFIGLLKKQGMRIKDQELHITLFKQLSTLHATGRNGIWARIIKNAFAPVFLAPVDFIIGNPPWVNWESLPGEYRDDLKPLWKRYDLFSLDAVGGSMGGGKKDLSMLFVYVCIDKYLKNEGKLAFVITQTLFKTTGAGDGFRAFRYDDYSEPGEATRYYIRPLQLLDLSRIQVFDGATNRTAVFIASKTKRSFKYPIPYEIWFGPSRISQDETQKEVEALTSRVDVAACPVADAKSTSPWLTVPANTHSALRKISGQSAYTGRAGCTTWMNGVFWVDVVAKAPRRGVVIENLNNVGKIKGIKKVRMAVEAELVYPLLRGRDVSRWNAKPSVHILLSQDPATRAPISERIMKTTYPRAFSYLHGFEAKLKKRSGYKRYFSNRRVVAPFYALYNVGPYTLAPWKVLWPEVGHTIAAGVVGPYENRPAIPDHTLIFVGCETEQEAYYISGILNSIPANLLVRGYIALHPSPHVLENVRVERFDAQNALHKLIADVGRAAHSAQALNHVRERTRIEEQLNEAVADLYEIDSNELARCREGLVSLIGADYETETDDEEESNVND